MNRSLALKKIAAAQSLLAEQAAALQLLDKHKAVGRALEAVATAQVELAAARYEVMPSLKKREDRARAKVLKRFEAVKAELAALGVDLTQE